MRIINLDDIGVKLLSSCKDQVYIYTEELPGFANGNYTLNGNILTVNGTDLTLSDRDLEELPSILHYVKQKFLNVDEDEEDETEA